MSGTHERNEARPLAYACRALIALIVITASGCTSLQGVRDYIAYNDTTNDFVMGWRNQVWARQAWHERKGQFVGEPQFVAFGDGFRSGYESVASGGNGCPPPLPPRGYWNWKYQSPEGQAKVAAWFAGFPHGARAAEEDGAGMYQQIQVSHPIERQYSPEFLGGYMVPTDAVPTAPAIDVPPAIGEPLPVPGPGSIDLPPMLDTSGRGKSNSTSASTAIMDQWPDQQISRENQRTPVSIMPAAFAPSDGWPGTVRVSAAPPVQLNNNVRQ